MENIAKKTLPGDVGYQWTTMSYQEKLTGNQLYYLFGLSVLSGGAVRPIILRSVAGV